MVICGGLPGSRDAALTGVVRALSGAEQSMLIGWRTPPPGTRATSDAEPPGRGNFLVKVGGRPGIPVHVDLTAGRARAQRHQQAVARAQPPEASSTAELDAA